MSAAINTYYEDRHEQLASPEIAESEQNFIDAKSYLLSATTNDGVNLYDHLAHCITRLLTERPNDGAEMFDDLSKTTKSEATRPQHDTLRDRPAPDSQHILAEEQRPLFEKADNNEEYDDEALQSPLPNILEQAYYFEQAGIGLGRDEAYRIWLGLKQLVDKYQPEKLRFWGKIFGTQKNYYIAEAEQHAGKSNDDDDDDVNEETNVHEDNKDAGDEDVDGEDDPLPKSTYKPPPVVPKEERGTGVNKYTYYVCNHPGAPWVKLPIVTPLQIAQARLIKHFFTGDLYKEIKSYPAYPGTEKNYLRAQIARISATTHVSPSGKYKFSEEEEAEEEAARENFQEDEEFKGIPLSELVNEELSGWVHHVQYLLPQGRTKWWNPGENNEKEEDENEEEEEMKAETEDIEPEQGPPLLTPIGNDSEIQNTKAWTAKITSNLIPQYACGFVRSNLWPGAYAFARGMAWENVYVGYGHKFVITDYGPELPPLPANEYSDGPEIGEAEDPSPEEEAKARAAEEQQADEDEEEQEEEAEEDEEDN